MTPQGRHDGTAALATGSDAIDGLRLIEFSDHPRFAAAAAASGASGWSYFFPYLYFFSQPAARERLLYEQVGGSLLVYRIKQDGERISLSLLVPPMPFVPEAMRHANARMAQANADGRQRIARVPDELAPLVAKSGFDLRFNADEYIYDAAQIRALAGSRYASLRRKLAHDAFEGVTVKPYTAADRPGCEALLDTWQRGLRDLGVRVGPYRTYARRCLAQADRLDPAILSGQVIEIDGSVAAFTFGGPINPEMSSLFITVSDRSVPGLAYLQRYRFIRDHATPLYWNDFVDSGRAGLAQMKRSFRPVRMHPLYSARRSGPVRP